MPTLIRSAQGVTVKLVNYGCKCRDLALGKICVPDFSTMSTTTTTTQTKKQNNKKPKQVYKKKVTTTQNQPKEQKVVTTQTKQNNKKPKGKKQGVPQHIHMDPVVLNAARAWILHMSDPFSYPPVSIGASGLSNRIMGSYIWYAKSPASTTNDAVFAVQPGCLTNTTGLAPFSMGESIGGAGLFSATVNAAYWSNATSAASVVGVVRPISCAIKVCARFPSSVSPPQFYAGQLPSTTSNSAVLAYAPVSLIPSTTNHKGGVTTTSMMAVWVPQDFQDLGSFNTNMLASYLGGTTQPYVGAALVAGQTAITFVIECIVFYEFQATSSANLQFFEASPPAPYAATQMWEAYLRLRAAKQGVKLVTENPKVSGHKHGDKHGLAAMGDQEPVNPMPEMTTMVGGPVENLPSSSYSASNVAQTALAAVASLAAANLQNYNLDGVRNAGNMAPPAALVQPECLGCRVILDKPGLCDTCRFVLDQHQHTQENAGVSSVHTTPEAVTRKLDVLKRELMGVLPPVRDLQASGISTSKLVQ
jgi:hypothetical protein